MQVNRLLQPATSADVKVYIDLEKDDAGFQSQFRNSFLQRGAVAVTDKVRWPLGLIRYPRTTFLRPRLILFYNRDLGAGISRRIVGGNE